jgi:L-galactose dehydrogenase/L-glyceraldehyde 3-phosphate reductase
VRDVLDEVIPALEALQKHGKTRFWGITALGDTGALHRLLDGSLHTAQVCCNLLNPSASRDVPPGFPAQDFGRLLDSAKQRGIGAIIIRVLAAGALSGEASRHPVAVPTVEPIGTGPDYASDVRRARALRVLVDEGHAGSLVEAALRFPLGSDAVSTVLLGYSSLEQLEYAATSVGKGPLSAAAGARLSELWAGFSEH